MREEGGRLLIFCMSRGRDTVKLGCCRASLHPAAHPLAGLLPPTPATRPRSSMGSAFKYCVSAWTGANQLSGERDKSQCIIDNNNYVDMRISC